MTDRIFYVTIADADIGSLKYHLRFLNKYLYHRLPNFECYRMMGTTSNFELFDKKASNFLTKRRRYFGRVSVA